MPVVITFIIHLILLIVHRPLTSSSVALVGAVQLYALNGAKTISIVYAMGIRGECDDVVVVRFLFLSVFGNNLFLSTQRTRTRIRLPLGR